MKKILPLLLAGLLSGAASARTPCEPGRRHDSGAPRSAPAFGAPEPLTILALAGGAAVAGGIVHRRTRK